MKPPFRTKMDSILLKNCDILNMLFTCKNGVTHFKAGSVEGDIFCTNSVPILVAFS